MSPPHVGLPLILFTDGACDPDGPEVVASCGAVLFDRRDETAHVFGCWIHDGLIKEWTASGRKQVVTEAEILPLLIARRVWFDRLKGCKLLNFVDNDGAKFACIRGTYDTPECALVLKAMFFEETKLQTWSWFSRVCSYSNCSDAPSRLDLKTPQEAYNAKVWRAPRPVSLWGGQWAEAVSE